MLQACSDYKLTAAGKAQRRDSEVTSHVFYEIFRILKSVGKSFKF
jgi:hypothetical protein